MPMTEHSILGLGPHGFHQVAYFQWGDPRNDRVLICVHGLTRRGRDFDWLARSLEERYRVVCVDLPGRGQSDWLSVAADYQPSTYLQDAAALIARLECRAGGLARRIAGRPDGNDAGGAAENADSPAGSRRYRRLCRRRGVAADRRLRRSGSGLSRPGRSEGLHAGDQHRLRSAHRRAVGASRHTRLPSRRERRLATALRSEARRTVQRRLFRAGGAMAAVGSDRLPGADSARRRTPTSSPPRRPRRWSPASRGRSSSNSKASATRRC